MSTKRQNNIFINKILSHTLIISSLLAVIIISMPPVYYGAEADTETVKDKNLEDRFSYFHKNTINPHSALKVEINVNTNIVEDKPKEEPITLNYEVLETINTTITGYSSTVDQTNSEPFITASGAWVRDGIVAANFLPFGTKIRIPEYFGDKVFIVKDRMNRRYTNRVDVWFYTRQEAINFGLKNTYIEIIQ